MINFSPWFRSPPPLLRLLANRPRSPSISGGGHRESGDGDGPAAGAGSCVPAVLGDAVGADVRDLKPRALGNQPALRTGPRDPGLGARNSLICDCSNPVNSQQLLMHVYVLYILAFL